jgi:hypothetical protein
MTNPIATDEQALRFAAEPLVLVRRSHNCTWKGTTCFVKCFGSEQSMDCELLGREFARQNDLALDILSIDKARRMVKYAMGQPAHSFDETVAAAVVHSLHQNFSSEIPLPSWKSMLETREKYLSGYPDLLATWRDLVSRIDAVGWKPCALHSDVARHNMLSTHRGTIVIDWEGLIRGPAEWDFTAAWINNERFAAPHDWKKMLLEYRRLGGVVNEEMLPLVFSLRQLHSLSYVTQVGRRNPDYQVEAQYRAQYLRSGSQGATWTIAPGFGAKSVMASVG